MKFRKMRDILIGHITYPDEERVGIEENVSTGIENKQAYI